MRRRCGQGPGFFGTKLSRAEISFLSRLYTNRPVELRSFQHWRELISSGRMMRVTDKATPARSPCSWSRALSATGRAECESEMGVTHERAATFYQNKRSSWAVDPSSPFDFHMYLLSNLQSAYARSTGWALVLGTCAYASSFKQQAHASKLYRIAVSNRAAAPRSG